MSSNIGKKLKIFRNKKGYTLKQLSDLSEISISFISDIENGRRNPSIDTLQSIANALNVPIDEFFQDEKTKDNKLDERAEYIESIKLDTAEDAMKFILQQPSLMAFGGYDLNKMTEEEIVNLANDMLFAMKLSLEKNKRK